MLPRLCQLRPSATHPALGPRCGPATSRLANTVAVAVAVAAFFSRSKATGAKKKKASSPSPPLPPPPPPPPGTKDEKTQNTKTAIQLASHASSRLIVKYSPHGRDGETSAYPHLHAQVMARLAGKNITDVVYVPAEDHDDNNVIDPRDTRLMGRFECANGKCDRAGWGSKVVPMSINRHGDKTEKTIRYSAVVYHQLCKSCEKVGKLYLNEKSYVDRVVWRVLYWAEIKQRRFPRKRKEGLPHPPRLCIGCQRGHCKQGKQADDEDSF